MVKQVKQATSETIEFVKRLSGMVIALSFYGIGVYGVIQAHSGKIQAVYAVALVFGGGVNVIAGSIVLFRVLMRKEI